MYSDELNTGLVVGLVAGLVTGLDVGMHHNGLALVTVLQGRILGISRPWVCWTLWHKALVCWGTVMVRDVLCSWCVKEVPRWAMSRAPRVTLTWLLPSGRAVRHWATSVAQRV